MPGSQKFSKEFHEEDYSNVLEVLGVCLELSSISEKYFGFLVNNFSKLVHTIKSLCSQYACTYLEHLWFGPPVRNSHRIWMQSLNSNLLWVFEVCLELPNQFGFVLDEFSALGNTTKLLSASYFCMEMASDLKYCGLWGHYFSAWHESMML